MVGFPSKPANNVEGERADVDQDPKVKAFKDPLDSFNPKPEDFSFLDSFLDFDSINWLEGSRDLDNFALEDSQFGFFEDGTEMEMIQEGVNEENRVENQTTLGSESIEVKSEPFDDSSDTIGVNSAPFDGVSEPVVRESGQVISDGSRLMVDGSEPVLSGGSELIESIPVVLPTINVEEKELKKPDGLTCSIEVEMEKVSLAADGDGKNDGTKNESDSSESGSEEVSSSSTSASDSSSSSEEESDKEEEKKKEEPDARKEDNVAVELEEGEIKSVDGEEHGGKPDGEDELEYDDDVDAMVAWSDDEDEDQVGTQMKGPIRSKNELKELPPVPAVDVTLEPHHAMLPVGVVLSVLGTQVIVEGVEKHNPLNEGSIFWITEKRAPLGLVDEIFGPVKNPYYVVRYNLESEVPDGIHQGTPISFVAEFVDHVLNDKNLYKKGYDASGDNDEEISDEVEFSDDEKEAEYNRTQKMAKRGMNQQKLGNMKNNKKKKNRQMNRYPGQQTENHTGQSSRPSNPNQKHALSSMLSSGHADSQLSGVPGQTLVGMSSLVPPLPQVPQVGGFPANRLANGHAFSSGLLANGLAWCLQNNQQQQHRVPIPEQMAIPNLVSMQNQIPMLPMQNQMAASNPMMFQQQFGAGQVSVPNVVIPGVQASLNFFSGPSAAPWRAIVGQNCGNQTFGISLNGHPSDAAQGEPNFNPFISHVSDLHSHSPHQYSMGASPMRGRRPYHRGGGRFGRGRGRQQSG